MKVFSLYDFGVPSIFHFPSLELPQELCLNEGRYCNKRTPFHLRILKVFTSCSWGKEVLEKMISVLEKSLMFSPKILFEPCLDLRMTMRIKFYFKFFCKYFFKKRHPGKLHFTFPHQANMVLFIEVGYGIFPPKLFLFMCVHYLILLNFLNSFSLYLSSISQLCFDPYFFSLSTPSFFGCLVINTLNCQWFYPLSNNCIVYLVSFNLPNSQQ